MYRQNHPEAIYGAIASAPPVEAISNNSHSHNYWNWNIWVSPGLLCPLSFVLSPLKKTTPPNKLTTQPFTSQLNNVYQDRSALASSKIKNAIRTLEQRFESGEPRRPFSLPPSRAGQDRTGHFQGGFPGTYSVNAPEKLKLTMTMAHGIYRQLDLSQRRAGPVLRAQAKRIHQHQHLGAILTQSSCRVQLRHEATGPVFSRSSPRGHRQHHHHSDSSK